MIEIHLTKDRSALIDDEDAYLTRINWYASESSPGVFYARGEIDGARVYLHRVIMQAERGQLVDHRNGDTLDCRRANLRLATKRDNNRNRRSNGWKGTSWCKPLNKWRSHITVDYVQRHLGYHDTREAAARAYDDAAKRHYGEFARLNFPETASCSS